MAMYILIPLIIASAAVTIYADIRKRLGIRAWAKPLTTTLIILLAASSYLFAQPPYVYLALIAAGLLFSLGGDTALLFTGERSFMIGLVLFLTAHIIYTAAFITTSPFVPYDIITGAMILAVVIAVYRILWPGLGAMKVPVLVYALIISFMLLRAISTVYGGKVAIVPAVILAAGSILFYSSDMILAINRFRRNGAPDGFPVLSTYYAGQTLIALSASFLLR